MSTSFYHDINSPSGDHVYADEEMAIQLLAEELAFQSPCGSDQREGTPQTATVPMTHVTWSDLELAKMLQVREDEQSMFASTAEENQTDLEMAKMLQVDADEEMVADCVTEDKKSDLELAKLMQQQEDIAASDFLIAEQLQQQFEQEGAKRCQRCGQQSCQGHSHFTLGHHERRRQHEEEAGDRDPHNRTSRGAMMHRLFQSQFPLPGAVLGGGQSFHYTNTDDDNYETLLELGETIGDARPLGLGQEEMNALPTCRFNSNSHSTSTAHVKNDCDSSDCRICFCAFSDNEVLRTLPCLHLFHRDCIDQWIQRKAICPICRVAIKEHIAGSSSH